MTVSDEASTPRSEADPDRSSVDGTASSVTVFRWTCPICGESRTGMASGQENPLGKAEFSLRQHVQTRDDDAHGPANAFPAGFDSDAADRAVSID